MVAIPFPVSSAPGAKPQEGSGRLINCFAIKTEQGARFPVLWRASAGLRELVDAGTTNHSHFRGGIYVSSTLIVVFDTRVYTVVAGSGSYTATNQGALGGTDRVTIARNNAGTPNIVAVSTSGVFNLFTGSAPTAFADADVGSPNSVCAVAGYFFFTYGNGTIKASGLNAVNIDTNSFTTYQSKPGGLLRGVNHRGELVVFGPVGGAVYRDAAASPFPFQFVTDIPRGIVGTHAVAGWEDGWSSQLIWAAEDYTVCRLNGYQPEPISNDDVSRAIKQAVRDGLGSLLEASVYADGNYSFWRLTNPGEWTWEYNATTGNWQERKSYGRSDHRGTATVKAFDLWVVGDRTTGKLFSIDETYYREGSDSLAYILRSGPAAAFPSRLEVPRMDFDFTAAVASASGEDPVQTDPTVLVRWSQDGGYSFGNPVTRRLGQEGDGQARVTVLRGPHTGPKGIVVEVEIDDPVHRGFLGGQMAVTGLSE